VRDEEDEPMGNEKLSLPSLVAGELLASVVEDNGGERTGAMWAKHEAVESQPAARESDFHLRNRTPVVTDRRLDVPNTSADYRNAALERIGDARALRRVERYPFAAYAAGLAAECMLRAFQRQGREHAAHHDVVAHFAACDRARLGERVRKKLRGPVQTVHVLWLNNLRYSHEVRLRTHLNDVRYYARVKRGSDTLKVACIELMNAASAIVNVGDERWRNP
jgi:hypothetical protein